MRRLLILSLVGLVGTLLSSCAYRVQTSKGQYFEERGIKYLYVNPLENDTYKMGIETKVYSALVEGIAARGRVKVVRNIDHADAILTGRVTAADLSTGAAIGTHRLQPLDTGTGNVSVAAVYEVHLQCSFNLAVLDEEGKESSLWGEDFERTKSFASSTQMGSLGTTSALINESKFDRALQELAELMMADVHESMLAAF